MFRQYQKFINSIFSINEELFYRLLGFRSNSGYWNLPVLAFPFVSVILYLHEIGNLLTFVINVILVVVYLVTFFLYRDDSLEYREVSIWRLVILSLIFHFICFIPFIFVMYLRGHF